MFLRPNYVITKKPKNARMGKGKGMFIRWCSILPGGFMLIELYGFQYKQVRKYAARLERRLKTPLIVLINPTAQLKENTIQLYGAIETPITFLDFKTKQ